MGFLRTNFHVITGAALLTLAGGSALALYLDVPAAIKNRQALHAPKAAYTCPMHAEVVHQGPGDCPKCGMALVPAEKKNSACAPNPAGPTVQPADSCAKDESGCCPKKPIAEEKILPAGHPPVPGWVVATNRTKAAAP